MSSPADDDDDNGTAYMDGVDIAAKKAKLLLDNESNEEKGWVKRAMPERPYPHLALRLVLTRLLHKKDPQNACARAFCVGAIHDPSLVVDVERRFMAGRFHPELEYWDLKHPWSAQKSVPMMVCYIMVTDGIAESWNRGMIWNRFSGAQKLWPFLTAEEWDTFIFNAISQNLVVYTNSAHAMLWLNDDRAVESVLNLHTGHHILQSLFSGYMCQCNHLPDDEETRTNVSLPRLRRVVQLYQQRERGVTVNNTVLGCLMQPPFGDTIFPAIDWANMEQFEPDAVQWHCLERLELENERQKRWM